MPDKFAVHGYESERDRHRDNAKRALTLAKQHLDSALARLDEGPSAVVAHDTRQLYTLAGEAHSETEAFLALHEVRFLVTDPDGEATHEH